ncbi:MAG: non-heme iron oxygenase ferredoxin subunit [Chloroflexota bacterium]|nr:non-heme iron oxygenase ferredoxin subunit [Chloroflexota bacterium]MDE2896227.1 non-heme iron oxygenase ferredoxin subunit [Chloroflexota bacterium]
MTLEHVGSLDEIEPGTARVVEAGGQSIALCRVEEGDLYAIENRCTHDDGPLGEGELDGDRIECPRHGALFDVTTGRAVTLPAIGKVRCFAVSVDDGQVQIEVD